MRYNKNMVKNKTVFICQECGYQSPKWAGRCPQCHRWNTFEEQVVEKKRENSDHTPSRSIKLKNIKIQENQRIPSGIGELDRVLGGGIVPGSVILLAGEPGIGKSTLLLQLASSIAAGKKKSRWPVFYVCGEESPGQIKIRAQRLAVGESDIIFLPDNDVDRVIAFLRRQSAPFLIIVDSIQTMTTEDLSGAAGSIGQVRHSASRLITLAKREGLPLILTGHVTKEGSIAGPKVLEHAVDTVIYFEGEQYGRLRLLRSRKNRFGRSGEVGVFQMTSKGLLEVDNPSKIFLSKNRKNAAGTVKTVILKGTRPLILEVQALVTKTNLAYPRRLSKGIDRNRLELQVAVLQKQLHLPLYKEDVILNIVGGVRIDEPAVDLASCLAVWSSYKNKVISNQTVAFGEVDLLGEIRPVVEEGRRIKEARRLGYKKIISSQNATNLAQAIKRIGCFSTTS